MRLTLALCLGLGLAALGLTASAQTLMTAEDYEAYSQGRTLNYAIDGTVYGAEQHLPGRKTLDADLGQPCAEGTWFPEGDAICFVYAGHDGTHCWHFWREGDQVRAKPVGEGADISPREVTVSATPLTCPGPDVGV